MSSLHLHFLNGVTPEEVKENPGLLGVAPNIWLGEIRAAELKPDSEDHLVASAAVINETSPVVGERALLALLLSTLSAKRSQLTANPDVVKRKLQAYTGCRVYCWRWS